MAIEEAFETYKKKVEEAKKPHVYVVTLSTWADAYHADTSVLACFTNEEEAQKFVDWFEEISGLCTDPEDPRYDYDGANVEIEEFRLYNTKEEVEV